MDLTHRSDDQLLLDVGELVGSHRIVTAKLSRKARALSRSLEPREPEPRSGRRHRARGRLIDLRSRAKAPCSSSTTPTLVRSAGETMPKICVSAAVRTISSRPSRCSVASTCGARGTFASNSDSHATRRKSGLRLGKSISNRASKATRTKTSRVPSASGGKSASP